MLEALDPLELTFWYWLPEPWPTEGWALPMSTRLPALNGPGRLSVRPTSQMMDQTAEIPSRTPRAPAIGSRGSEADPFQSRRESLGPSEVPRMCGSLEERGRMEVYESIAGHTEYRILMYYVLCDMTCQVPIRSSHSLRSSCS